MHKQIVKAKRIESLPAGVKAVSSLHKFLYASLLAGVRFYEDDAGLEYMQFFDSVIQKNIWLYKNCIDCNPCPQTVSERLKAFVKGIPVFKHLIIEGIEFLSLITGLFISAFIWHTLVAFRRHAKH